MAGMGTLLTTLGWTWLIFAFVGPAFGLDRLPFLPAIALLFGGRLLKAQARRRGADGEDDLSDLSAPSPAGTPSPPVASPTPTQTRSERGRSTIGLDPSAERDAEARASGAYAEALRAAAEDVLEDVAESEDEILSEPGSDEVRSVGLSSAEMVARARRRWDRKV